MTVVSLRHLAAALLLLSCAGCGVGSRSAVGWDGRRGYDGNGDYGYDLAASRSEASRYRARAARSYPAPGTPSDPWGPYVREAADRFQIPERWIRAVMRQESGGHQFGADGAPVTSGAGAMGLMQVMPRTYDTLRQNYALGPDPYDPHNNILAGAAYIRDMYAIYGSPGFLAAYNAGPDRLASYLAGSGTLPDETVNYLASVAPHLGNDVAMTGPLAVYGGTATVSPAYAAPSDAAYAGGGTIVQTADAAVPDDPSDRAFDGGGLVTPDAPTGLMTGSTAMAAGPANQGSATLGQAVQGGVLLAALPVPADGRGVVTQSLIAPATLMTPAPPPYASPGAAPPARGGPWAIQVGAFPDPAVSQAAIGQARSRAADLLAAAQPAVIPVQRDGTLYRARLVGLSAAAATAACSRLAGAGMACFAVPPGF